MATDFDRQVSDAAAVLVPLIKAMGEVQAELRKEPGCNGWHSGIQMYYARNHYAREGKDAASIMICPVHGNMAR